MLQKIWKLTKNGNIFNTKKSTKKLKKSFKKVLTKQNECGTIKNVLGSENREQSTLKNKQ